jgi:Transient receptor potential (TRP) ion channel/ML-like domain
MESDQQSRLRSGRWLRYMSNMGRWRPTLVFAAVMLAMLPSPGNAAYMTFDNCLSDNVINNDPTILQFDPLNVTAFFNTTAPNHHLNITIYGNVSGLLTVQPYPAPDDPQWANPNDTLGKIVDLDPTNNKYTTLFSKFTVLSYTPYQAPASRFCNSTINGDCPLAPAFYTSKYDLERLPAFSLSHDMFSTYAFTSITATMRVVSGDVMGQTLACISTTITPNLGSYLSNVLIYLPLVILLVVGIATICAAILSPWGSVDTFRWTSNFGRDEDLLRLVTPGFGDCLQYVQFIVLTGSLSLNYPGYYQPVVSKVGWSSLMFNESFVSGGNGTQSVVDGLYQLRPNSAYGLDRMSQYIGMTSVKDIWADMMVWLVVIVGGVAILTQVGFAARWLYRMFGDVPAEDLRSKNWPFTAGNVVRTVFNYFLLPLVSLSMFQLVIAGRGPAYSVALAVIVLVAIVAFSVRLLLLFARTKPRQFLFDDLPTVLTYGPLYNTYCDDAATFALIPVLLCFIRGIAIGAVQQSGIAQLVLLAICEIILILTLNAFRPFPSATSMNVYHTFFSCIRLVTVLLSIAFVPSLGVADDSRGWIGYAILLIHAAVLVFGFFLNAMQTLIEVFARRAGAGGGQSDASRGGLTKVFGMRQLSKRVPRRDAARHSMASGTAMLAVEGDQKSVQLEAARSRSLSASSTMLLNRSEGRQSHLFSGASPYTDGQASPSATSTFSRQPSNRRISGTSTSPGAAIAGISQVESKDPYYRPPRRNTMDPLNPADKRPRASFTSADWAKRRLTQSEQDMDSQQDAGEGASTSAVGNLRDSAIEDDEEEGENELSKTKTDYAVREVDFYYGVRGPALSSGTRKLKTGPADPTGPVSSATGWFKSLIGGKTKEKGKGFEVVRSSRAPPGLFPALPEETGRGTPDTYQDEPHQYTESPRGGEAELEGSAPCIDTEEGPMARAPARPPSLPLIDTGGDIEMPSRVGSHTSHASKRPGRTPMFPRRSSRKASSQDAAAESAEFSDSRLPAVAASPEPSPQKSRQLTTSSSSRLPFQPTAGHKRYSIGGESAISSHHGDGDEENQAPQPYTHHGRNSSSALGVHAADLRGDRPSSIGLVQQHRASDNIHYSPESPEFAGSSAEFLEQPQRSSRFRD